MHRVLPWVVAGVVLVVFGIWYARVTPGVAAPTDAEHAADFPNYYFAGERLRSAQPVYDSLEREVFVNFDITGYDTYPADPPSTVALFAPLSSLEYRSAWYLWSFVSMVLLAGSVWLVARELGYGFRGPWPVAMAAAALLTTPARFLFQRNHMETLLLALGVVGWLAWRRKRSRLAAVGFGAATGLKFFPGMWLLGLLRTHPRHGLTGVLTAAVLLAGGALIIGFDNTTTFVTDVISRSSRWYGSLGNYSLLSFGTALVGEWLGWVLTGVGAAILLPRYLVSPPDADRVMVQGTAAALLLSPLSWLNYLVLAIPALLIVSCRMVWSLPRHRIGFAILAGGLMFWGPVVFESEILSILVSFIPTYALVALFFLGSAAQSPTQDSASSPSEELA